MVYRMARRYIELGVWGGWSRERVYRCCQLLGETTEELAASIAIRPGLFKFWVKGKGRVPSYVALLCHMREQDYLRARGLSES